VPDLAAGSAFGRALRAALAQPALGPVPSMVVQDAATGQVLIAEQADRPRAPASTLKILTAAAALTVLGPGTRLPTRVLRSGDMLYLVGGGDPTLTQGSPSGYPVHAPLIDLAARTAGALSAPGSAGPSPGTPLTLVGDGSLFPAQPMPPGWKSSYLGEGDVAPVTALEVDGGRFHPGTNAGQPRVPDPALTASVAFAVALHNRGVSLSGIRTGLVPAGAEQVAMVQSPPVSALVEQMLTYSDNDIAESLGRLVALRRGLPATSDGEAQALKGFATRLGLAPDGIALYDASGLSALDRIPARTLAQLLNLAGSPQHPELHPLLAALPVAGFTGTVAARLHGDAAAGAGVARLKSGTLADVNTLLGVVTDADGRMLDVVLLADGSKSAAQSMLDRLVAVLASCGCRSG
jgi:D-alanyl-D-alanine carboxypeptidase/D-alanyl-D-alanine-endopeptidase (penicillin-binding protein 4)